MCQAGDESDGCQFLSLSPCPTGRGCEEGSVSTPVWHPSYAGVCIARWPSLNAAYLNAASLNAALALPPTPLVSWQGGNTPNLRIKGAFDPQSTPSRCIIPVVFSKKQGTVVAFWQKGAKANKPSDG